MHLPRILPRGLLTVICVFLPAGKAWNLCPDFAATKRPYFGDLHVHTSYSLDAYARGARNDPWDAYRFAKKDTAVGLTPNQGPLNLVATRQLEIDRALDFSGVTDHAEYLGDSGRVCSYLGRPCPRDSLGAWQRNIRAAQDANDPCRFTAFIAYEYTLGERGTGPKGMRHRNVIFANDSVPSLPAHSLDYPTPGSLWAKLFATCLNAGTGCDVLAIAHNPNYSKGTYFETETETGRQWIPAEAALRGRMEPLVEMIQHKGASECLQGIGNTDEECAFEYDDGREAVPNPSVDGTHYIREGLKMGLQQLDRFNVNPFKLGFIGSTDTHNGTPGAIAESQWKGHAGDADDTPQSLLASAPGTNPGGLAVVWAEENTRESLFRALRRRETYATSGPRMIVRMFGGWNWPANVCSAPNRVAIGYRDGVPMGGDMPDPPPGQGALPTFVVAAAMDPVLAPRPGSLLQKIEIIKGWKDAAGAVHERVFLVAGASNNGATVDLATCNQSGPGATDFCVTWTDTAFRANQAAFYYARVIENPSCHWSRFVANASGQPHPAALPDTIRERAWTSPIWYDPLAGQRLGVKRPGSGKGSAAPSFEVFSTPRKITVRLQGFSKPTHMRLLDAQGRFLKEIRLDPAAADVVVEKGALPEGSYVLQVFHQGKTRTRRFFW